MSDEMVVIAKLISRSETMVVASLLRAHDILVHVGGEAHASVEINPVTLGGYAVTIPKSQHQMATAILADTFAKAPYNFSVSIRSKLIRFILVYSGLITAIITPSVLAGRAPFYVYLIVPLASFSIPANTQGTGDYYLYQSSGDTG